MKEFDFITGDKFATVGDMVYSLNYKEDANPMENTFCHYCLRAKNIVYTHTMYVKKLFEEIRGLKCSFVIVTHNCDENVDESYQIPDNVTHWFAQNVNVVNPRITSIPIGLENDKWFKGLKKKGKMMGKTLEPKNHKNLVYMNHNVNTYPKERFKTYYLLEGKSWVTARRGNNGENFDDYLDNIYNHRFVICPRGNGLDTHRLWETLYMGSIPIVKKDINNSFYNDLPILYVNGWEEVTEKLLEEALIAFGAVSWNWKKLTFEYWKNLIKNYE